MSTISYGTYDVNGHYSLELYYLKETDVISIVIEDAENSEDVRDYEIDSLTFLRIAKLLERDRNRDFGIADKTAIIDN